VTLAELLAELGNGRGMDAFVAPRRPSDAGERSSDADAALTLLAAFPEWIGDLGQLSGPPGHLFYRGGHQAEIRVLDVTALGFHDARAFVAAAVERDADAVVDRDLEGDVASVTLDAGEAGGNERFVVVRGPASAPWAFTIAADAREAATAVAEAADGVLISPA
jgi:hypothetical protein